MPTHACFCWFLSGPTASGKTSVGLELAQLLDADIISLDSMAIYRDMDVGTAKPTVEQRRQVPHHLIDIVDPDQEYSLAQYIDDANEKIDEIRRRGRPVLFVGGTPLYLKSLLRGIFAGPPANWDFRRQVQEEVRAVGTKALHDRLRQIDPLSASRLHPHDVRRIVRALEVYKVTGKPISHMQLQFDEGANAEERKVFSLQWQRDELHLRIGRRVRRMFELGLLDEARRLLSRYSRLSRTASQAVGYREVLAHFDGEYSEQEAIDRIVIRTRRFAKRQETWFRGLSECRRVPCHRQTDPHTLARQILALGLASDQAAGQREHDWPK